MATFVGSYENKVDAKGRVSVPARFRTAIAGQAYQGIVVAPSPEYDAIDACDHNRLTQVSEAIDDPQLYTDEQRLEAEIIISRSLELPLDENGRIQLPQNFLAHAGIDGRALFVGIGPTFQIWHPERRADHLAKIDDRARPGASLRLLPRARGPSA
jgi:MraZ protein